MTRNGIERAERQKPEAATTTTQKEEIFREMAMAAAHARAGKKRRATHRSWGAGNTRSPELGVGLRSPHRLRAVKQGERRNDDDTQREPESEWGNIDKYPRVSGGDRTAHTAVPGHRTRQRRLQVAIAEGPQPRGQFWHTDCAPKSQDSNPKPTHHNASKCRIRDTVTPNAVTPPTHTEPHSATPNPKRAPQPRRPRSASYGGNCE